MSRPHWERASCLRPPREGGASSPYRGRFFGGACVPALVLGFRTPNLPLLLLWEQGVGGMRGKSARECSKPRIAPKNAPLEQRSTGALPIRQPVNVSGAVLSTRETSGGADGS